MKHIPPLPPLAPQTAPTPPKRTKRATLDTTLLTGEEKDDGDAFAVGSATDGQARRPRRRPEREASSPEKGLSQATKVAAKARAAYPDTSLPADALRLFLDIQESDTRTDQQRRREESQTGSG